MNILNKTGEIVKMIRKASTVFLMAHRDLDLDAINSCIGMSFYLRQNGKKAYIIIDDLQHELGVKRVLESENKNIHVIKSKNVNNLKDDDSLLIILDTNKSKITQNPEIIDSFSNILNIDHHDKNKDSLKCDLRIIDEDVSSTCEMLTLFFRENNFKITAKIATLLLAGIVLDTNNYRLNTNARTFYNSYYLMECGAKMRDVNELLKQEIHDYVKRQKIISSVRVIKSLAIGRGSQRNEYKKEELAKSADSLLTFSKIKASFVVGKLSKDLIGISARSVGEVNVGEILEKFGGGGSEFEAAATVENNNVNKVVSELLKLINNL